MATEKITTFAGRLRLYRNLHDLGQEQMGKLLGVSGDFISQIETGRKKPGRSLILLFELLEKSPLDPRNDPEELSSKSPIHRHFKEESNVVPYNGKFRQIPVYAWAQAGQAIEYEGLPSYWEHTTDYDGKDPRAFALIIEGDSMIPNFQPGTIITVSPQYPPHNGQLVVAKIKDEGFVFKRFTHSGDGKKVILTSYNPVYPPIELPREKLHWIYRVVRATTNL